ncbi:calcineurin B homologous protein 1-like [Acanthaster planci]|uniref:Calcineurin B homologous protein 1-like n=1 Tax=Acanthaster planci TaxID=133434 RepID=A0A8B7YVL1_ACAPL|nr:calcineurin B homologous protein 1-like [Acanthaster planci]
MGSRTSSLLQAEEIEEIQKETGFSKRQIVRLYSRFTSLDKSDNGALSREDLLRIPELAINPLGDRIIHAFFMDNPESKINFRQFMRTLSLFRPIKSRDKDAENPCNSRDNKLKFAFRMYDLDSSGTVTREELLVILQMMVGSNITEEQLGSIADRTIAEADEDNSGAISYENFAKALERTDVEQMMSIRFLN